MYRLRALILSRRFTASRPDPTRPRYEDPSQNVFRSEKRFKEERTRDLKTGDNKRLLPLKTLVPEEYRGARYYTDREMEFVDPKNSKMRLFGGPYSLFFPHKDGRIECEGDRVPCNYSIKRSLHHGDPLVIDPMFKDQSRYGQAKRNPNSNPNKADQIRRLYIKVVGSVFFLLLSWRYGLAQIMGYDGIWAMNFTQAGYGTNQTLFILGISWSIVLAFLFPMTHVVFAIRSRVLTLLSRIFDRRI